MRQIPLQRSALVPGVFIGGATDNVRNAYCTRKGVVMMKCTDLSPGQRGVLRVEGVRFSPAGGGLRYRTRAPALAWLGAACSRLVGVAVHRNPNSSYKVMDKHSAIAAIVVER